MRSNYVSSFATTAYAQVAPIFSSGAGFHDQFSCVIRPVYLVVLSI